MEWSRIFWLEPSYLKLGARFFTIDSVGVLLAQAGNGFRVVPWKPCFGIFSPVVSESEQVGKVLNGVETVGLGGKEDGGENIGNGGSDFGFEKKRIAAMADDAFEHAFR